MFDDLLSSVWNISPIQKQEGSDKLALRQIGEKLFQFRKRPIRDRHDLALRANASFGRALGDVTSGLDLSLLGGLGAEDGKITISQELKAEAGMNIAAAVMQFAGHIEMRELIRDVMADAYLKTEEGFSSLKDDITYERAFADDMTAFIPVALTALQWNIDGFFDKLASAYASMKSDQEEQDEDSSDTTKTSSETESS